ncbi:MAG TPA: hypothetical protein VMU57_07560, partial [Edaphobacter sp.]|uniref:hypothetical protein n=1 Tax=Edaphobacter sp. TaxID=1934404 RepID=UPI002C7A7DC9
MEFRQGVFHALAKATNKPPSAIRDRESTVEIAQVLAAVHPSSADIGRLENAARCLVFDVCHTIGEGEV